MQVSTINAVKSHHHTNTRYIVRELGLLEEKVIEEMSTFSICKYEQKPRLSIKQANHLFNWDIEPKVWVSPCWTGQNCHINIHKWTGKLCNQIVNGLWYTEENSLIIWNDILKITKQHWPQWLSMVLNDIFIFAYLCKSCDQPVPKLWTHANTTLRSSHR